MRERQRLLKVDRHFSSAITLPLIEMFWARIPCRILPYEEACGKKKKKLCARGRNHRSWRPVGSLSAQRRGRGRAIDHIRHEKNKKCRRLVGKQPFAAAQQVKRREAFNNPGCDRKDDRRIQEHSRRYTTESRSRIQVNCKVRL